MYSNDDVREGPIVQEIVTNLGNLIRTQPYMFEGILRLRTHYIIIALREEISRTRHCDEEEAVEHLMQLSPFELKTLLSTILSGPALCAVDEQQQLQQESSSYIPLVMKDSEVVIKAQSGGYYAGNFAKVEINSTIMEASSRGIHAWVIDLEKRVILERESFDTHISEEESRAFVDFLNTLKPGTVVIMASKDEFTEHLTDEALFTMEQLGSTRIRQVSYRDSYVFIGELGKM